jgi:ABC-2 type transport system ATP-binding protein
MEEAARLCDRIAIMDHGKVIADDTLSGLLRLAPVASFVVIDLAAAFGRMAELRGLDGVMEVSANGAELRVGVRGMDVVGPLLSWLGANGAVVEHIRTERPTLETVFLHLTGRTLRDA